MAENAVKVGEIGPSDWFGVHEVCERRAAGYARLMQMGRRFPPVVVVDYDGCAMPLDGHHRLTASKQIGRPHRAVIFNGDWFEDQCIRRKDAGRNPPDSVLIALADRMDRRGLA